MARQPPDEAKGKLSDDRDAPRRGPERILDQHGIMFLTGADRDAFVDAVLNPPQPRLTLVEALRRHRSLFG